MAAKKFTVAVGGEKVSFVSKSACAKEMLANHYFVPEAKIAEFVGIAPQTVLRIDETLGLRRSANPKYAKVKA